MGEKWLENCRIIIHKIHNTLYLYEIIELKKLLGKPLSIKELGIPREDFETNLELLIDFCLKDDNIKMPHRRVEHEKLQNLYLYAYEGKNIDF